MTRLYLAAVQDSNCEIKTTLLFTWQCATDSYARVLSALSRRIGVMSPEEYHTLRLDVEDARKASKEARDDFEAHIRQHHCMIEEGATLQPLDF